MEILLMIIDAEFRALIPPLQADERAKLEQSILNEGCRDALVVWQSPDGDILVDGHNRHDICTAHNLPYNVVTRDFASRDDVKLWMIRNQLARRNLTPFNRTELALQMESVIAELAKQNQAQYHGNQHESGLLSNLTEVQPVNTRDELARIAETSAGNIHKVKKVLESAPDAIKQLARAGDISIHRASEITKQLQNQPQDVVDVALRVAGDNPEKIAVLSRLYKSSGNDGSNGTFDEIARTGGFHYGDEMDDWLDFADANYDEIKRALESVAKYHATIETDNKRGGVPPALQSSESNEWYTPAQYIDAVYDVMGQIDVDPASNAEANELVAATTYYDINSDGFNREWHGTVFMNPPYGRDAELAMSNQAKWTKRLIEQYNAGITTEAILLVNAVTDRRWFAPLWDYPICFTNHRVPFYRPGGDAGAQPVIGSVFVYFGSNSMRFADVFKQFGAVVLSTVRSDD
jgi:hypothetical protein